MEMDIGSWFNYPPTNSQLPNVSLSSPLDLRVQNAVPGSANPRDNMFSTNSNSSAVAISCSKLCQQIDGRRWFYCLPRYRQSLSPLPKSIRPEKLNAGLIQHLKGDEVSNLGPGLAQKRFIIFDQSNDRTTFVFSSGTHCGVQNPPWNPLILPPYLKDKPETERCTFLSSSPIYSEEINDVANEMREDSEEIDALLYSDDNDDDDNEYLDEDDEVMSTGHSPSMVIGHHGKEGWADESGSVDGSIIGLGKRQKVSNVGYSVPSLTDIASSVNSLRVHRRCFEDNAESSCGESKDQVLSGKKRSRQEKMRYTLSVLESLIRGENDSSGKDAIRVIDEAICYLRSLKVKAKALGIDLVEDTYL